MADRHVPARVWTLARLAAEHAWDVHIEPGYTRCDLALHRGGESVEVVWLVADGKSRVAHVTLAVERIGVRDVREIRLRDVRGILRGAW